MLTSAGLTRASMAVAGLTLALATAGCTSSPPPVDPVAGEGSPAPPSVRDRLVSLAVGVYAPPDDLEEGGCFADEVLAEVDEDELVGTGVLDASGSQDMVPKLPRKLVDPWVEAQFMCSDYVKIATRAQTFATGGQLDVMAYSACYGRKVTEEQSKAASRALLLRKVRGDKSWAAVRAAEDSCLREAAPAP